MTEHNREICEAIRQLKWELKLEREANGKTDTEKLLRLYNLYGFLNIHDLLTSDADYETKVLGELLDSVKETA